MLKHTALHGRHEQCSALLVDFAGWHMPLHYGSQIEEHHAVRRTCGMFDVSHMAVLDIQGEAATAFLRYLLANDVNKVTPRHALYSCLLNEAGGILDDLIVYPLSSTHYYIVINAGTREKDFAWFKTHALSYAVSVTLREDLSLLAVQGPQAIATVQLVLSPTEQQAIRDLSTFSFALTGEEYLRRSSLIARTGYTGEAGYEIIAPHSKILELWDALLAQGVKPCGLGARDTLRLEAGLNLYGSDMDETVTPLESNLAWTVENNREFIGRAGLQEPQQVLVGLVLLDRGVLRGHQVVVTDCGEGVITSGTFSPTLQRGIAFARVPRNASLLCTVEIRGKPCQAMIVKPPFIKKGQPTFTLNNKEQCT